MTPRFLAPFLPFVLIPLLLAGCGGFGSFPSASTPAATSPSTPSSAATTAPGSGVAPATPTGNDLLRVGDVLSVRLSGVPTEDEGVYEIKIGDQGDISMPLLAGTFHAAGLTTSQLKDEIESAYRDRKIYSTPNVTIVPELRYVNASGEVRTPQRIPFTNDLTVLKTITAAGGFSDYANRHDVHILRGNSLIHFDATQALKDPSLDIPLQAGDQIQVSRSAF